MCNKLYSFLLVRYKNGIYPGRFYYPTAAGKIFNQLLRYLAHKEETRIHLCSNVCNCYLYASGL